MTFESLKLISPILKALAEEGYTIPTPIQVKSIPIVLEGKDLFGCAQTGTGKTASFAIPILQMLHNAKKDTKPDWKIQALILTPTRELAIQIWESFAAYGKYTGITHTVIFGWVWQAPQVKMLRRGVDIVIATPGRLLDLINQRHVNLAHIKMFILDEADRMLDMWFINDIKKVLTKLPNKRQSLFFSATMPAIIMELAHTILRDPIKVMVSPVSSTVETVKQELYFVEKADKRDLLVHLLKDTSIESALVFTRTKHGADKVAQVLAKAGIATAAIHGNKSQWARQTALQSLKNKKIRVLVATDIAARWIDINELSHVFIFDIPTEPETYVHRIGRTGRAGAKWVAIAFCDSDEKKYLKEIIKVIKKDIPIIEDHPFRSKGVSAATKKPHQGRGAQKSRPNGQPSKPKKPYWGKKKSY
jgi:ATP-dependent RNA helicase RhlE